MKHRSARLAPVAIAIVIVIAGLAAGAPPASATVHPYRAEMVRGLLDFGGIQIPNPAGPPSVCPGSVTISGTIDDALATDNMTGALAVNSGSFTHAAFGASAVQLTATGATGAGSSRGDHSVGANPDTFVSLHAPTITFVIRRINTATCVPGITVCAGTATLTLRGEGFSSADTPPFPTPPATPEQMWVWSTGGSITSMTTPCPFPAGLWLRPGNTVSLAAHPAFPGDLGALYDVTDS